MPKIPAATLNIVCYLYRSEEDALVGRDFGGTGFLVGVPSKAPGKGYMYVVTTWHVAVRGGASVVRLNTVDGRTEAWSFGPEDWFVDPDLDIAIILLNNLDAEKHIYSCAPLNSLITKESVELNGIGPGEDVFMVGRFIDHDGGRVNQPAVRFGHISVNPTKIEQPNRQWADAYCIDMHSRSGYSGSPVFVFRTPGYDLTEQPPKDMSEARILIAGNNYFALLGIHFAQFPEDWEIQRRDRFRAENAVPLITDGMYVKGLSGMTCVLPAWEIARLLDAPQLKGPRDKVEATLTVPEPPSPEIAAPPGSVEAVSDAPLLRLTPDGSPSANGAPAT